MKNYYDELEVSKTASKEVISKVYKHLAKKYHPDTTKEIDKQFAEEKFKIISEAYDVLSDDEKRKKYDLELEQANPTISYEEYITVVNQRDSLNNALNNLKNEFHQYNVNNNMNYNENNYNTHFDPIPNQEDTNSKNKTYYYYTSTGKPASAFDYFKYRIKELFSSIFIFVLATLALVLFVCNIFSINIFDFFF